MKADFGRTASDYRSFRAGFPRSFFETLVGAKIITGRETVVDLGTGTGTVARGLASLGCRVIGIDSSPDMLNQAREMAGSGSPTVTWRQAAAEDTGLDGDSVDVVTAGQCWHWFDPEKAIREIRRLLRAGGRLVIAHFDWLPCSGNVVELTETLIREMNPDWTMGGGCGVYPQWFRHLMEGGFLDIRSLTYDEPIHYSHEAWRGRVRASAGVGGSMSGERVVEFDRRHARLLAEEFPVDPLLVPHRVFLVHGRRPGQESGL
ncbi:MAG: methyltransferase domain-containing protein [Opitutaceae bacterium]